MADEQGHPNPMAFGVDHLTKLVQQMQREMKAGFHRLEGLEKKIMAQIDDLNTVLTAVADAETKLGTDIGTVIDFLKSNPSPTDLTAQIATLTQVRDNLVNSDAKTLANLPPPDPFPDPAPAAGRR